MIRKIAVDNLKCSGCATSIKNKLNSLEGVTSVEVNEDNDIVTVEYEHHDHIWEDVIQALKGMGYAEKGTGNFIDKAKSYVSCAVGKMGA